MNKYQYKITENTYNLLEEYLNLILKKSKKQTFWNLFIIKNGATTHYHELFAKLTENTQDLVPISIRATHNDVTFLAKDCKQSLEVFCNNKLNIKLNSGIILKMEIILSIEITFNTKRIVEDVLRNALKARYNSINMLNLTNFVEEPLFKNEVYFNIAQEKVLGVVLAMAKQMFEIKELNLSCNKLKSLDAIMYIGNSLTNLDVSDNLLDNFSVFVSLKPLHLTKLFVDGNPLCSTCSKDEYVNKFKEIFPHLSILDNSTLIKGMLLFQRNFVSDNNAIAIEFVDQFLEHYFSLFDSDNRVKMKDLYHESSLLSLTVCDITHKIQQQNFKVFLDTFKKFHRNLLSISDYSKASHNLIVGSNEIVRLFEKLPKIQHDILSFTVDVPYFSDQRVVIYVTGVFRQKTVELSSEVLISFSRYFILSPFPNGEYKITNENWFLTNVTDAQKKRSFKQKFFDNDYLKVNNWTLDEQTAIVETMAKITTMNREGCRFFLVKNEWVLKNALKNFLELFKVDQVQQNFFF